MSARTDRRRFIKAIGLGVASLAMPGCLDAALRTSNKARADKPNIILIIADDLGYECLGCYGSASYKTPLLEEKPVDPGGGEQAKAAYKKLHAVLDSMKTNETGGL